MVVVGGTYRGCFVVVRGGAGGRGPIDDPASTMEDASPSLRLQLPRRSSSSTMISMMQQDHHGGGGVEEGGGGGGPRRPGRRTTIDD